MVEDSIETIYVIELLVLVHLAALLAAACNAALAVNASMRRALVDAGAMEGLLEACRTSTGPVNRSAEPNVRVKSRVLSLQLQYWVQVRGGAGRRVVGTNANGDCL